MPFVVDIHRGAMFLKPVLQVQILPMAMSSAEDKVGLMFQSSIVSIIIIFLVILIKSDFYPVLYSQAAEADAKDAEVVFGSLGSLFF